MIDNQVAEDLRRCCDALESDLAGAIRSIERWKARHAEGRHEIAKLKHDITDYVRISNEQGTEIVRMREALRWTAGALQAACHSSYRPDEADMITIDHKTRTVAQILDAANAALLGAAHD